MPSKHYLPSKLGTYLKRLELEYARAGNSFLREIIAAAYVTVIEETSYDNWNGGTYGHDVKLFLPSEIIGKIGLDEQRQFCEQLREDLNKCASSVDNESFRLVNLELAEESDPEFQRAISLSRQPRTDPDTLSIWTTGHLRLFLSHRDTHKVAARQLADALSSYGISAFVAHDTIEPMTTWQREIEKGLETMEMMLAFVTDDFHESSWTNQEVGYALGKHVPIISVKFERKEPFGFIGTKQALKGDLDHPERSAPAIYKILVEKLGQKARLQQTLVSAFASSPNWDEARARFDRMKEAVSSLNNEEIEQIQNAYSSNEQLNRAIYLNNEYKRLTTFMKGCTGQEFDIKDKKLIIQKPKSARRDDEIPF